MSKTNVRARVKRLPSPTLFFVPPRAEPGGRGPGLGSAEHDLVLAEAAHDLNNALNAVRLHLDLLALDLLASGCKSSDPVWKRLRAADCARRELSVHLKNTLTAMLLNCDLALQALGLPDEAAKKLLLLNDLATQMRVHLDVQLGQAASA